MPAALWDVVETAANLAQLSGLHAAMLVTVATSLLWSPRSRRECARLERTARELRALLQWPTGCLIAIQHTEMGGLLNKALHDADGLVESYNKTTLWRRVWNRETMVAQFHEMQNRISSYCGLVLFINGHLLMQSMNPSSEPSATIHHLVSDPSHRVQAATQCPTGSELPHSIGQEGAGRQAGNTVDPGCEILTDIVVISNA